MRDIPGEGLPRRESLVELERITDKGKEKI